SAARLRAGSSYRHVARRTLLRHQHRASFDLAFLQLVIDRNRFARRIVGGLRADPAGARHHDHFHELDASAPIGDAHGCSIWRASMVEIMMSAAQSNDRPRTVSTEQLCAEVERWLISDAIEDETRAACPDDLLDSLNGLGGIGMVDDVVRAGRFGVFQLRVVYIR